MDLTVTELARGVFNEALMRVVMEEMENVRAEPPPSRRRKRDASETPASAAAAPADVDVATGGAPAVAARKKTPATSKDRHDKWLAALRAKASATDKLEMKLARAEARAVAAEAENKRILDAAGEPLVDEDVPGGAGYAGEEMPELAEGDEDMDTEDEEGGDADVAGKSAKVA